MDLVEVAPTARPPVCRVMDYGKWKYHQKKKHKKGGTEQQLKEVRLRPKTDDNDKHIKIKRAIRFFGKGHKVQFTILFRGRERFHREIGFQILKGIAEDFGEKVKTERPPSMDGRKLIMILAPVKGAFEDLGEPEEDHHDDADLNEDSGVHEAQPADTTPAAEESPKSDAPAEGQ